MNVMMNRVVTQTLADVDVVLFVVEAGKWSPGDAKLLSLLHNPEKTILVISKIDQIKNRDELYPFVAKIASLYDFSAIVPVSANKNISWISYWTKSPNVCQKTKLFSSLIR